MIPTAMPPDVTQEQWLADAGAQGVQLLITPRRSFNIVEDQAYLRYDGLDLTGIAEIVIDAEASLRNGAAGGVIEIHLDGPDGTLVGSTEKIAPVDYNSEYLWKR